MNTFFRTLTFAVSLALSLSACQPEQPTYIAYNSYEYASLDESGGTWKPVLLTSPAQIGIPAPTDASSASFLAEVAEVKSLSASLTEEQQAAVDYWGSNALVRWNEIARDLAAKYNLPPAPNADGSYSVPDPANPGNYPYFPFAHPPYTCRMLAYWGAAQFDAQIAVWHYKYQYNRPAPYQADASITPHLPAHALPGYPSDGAAVAAVSKAILSAMFPLEKEFIAQKAAEHLNVLRWSGMNVASDLTAGDSLGRAVAAVFLARAGSDGMKKAQTPKAVSDSIRDAAQARFGWHWENQEDPVRPVGITPLFGKVKTWSVPDLVAVRPPVPPTPSSAGFETDATELRDLARKVTPEQRRIANFWSDGLGTYTPPGHWNRKASDYLVQYRQNPLRTARTFAYLNMALMDAGISCWDAKYYYHYPRPVQAMPGFKTILGTPNFPAYTSGHSTFSSAAATVLGHIFPEKQAECDAWADEAAMSRVYAGIHYRFDAEAGITQGKAVAAFTVAKAEADGAE
ncbi:MAG: phosphatase PAP2 family protein [Bacteroidia bacterium]|nr:phosphatase PAP2 family protein [Bacteroidia bacterium]